MLALAVLADATKLITARQRHGEGWVGAKHVAMMMETMQELCLRCGSDADDGATQRSGGGCVVVGVEGGGRERSLTTTPPARQLAPFEDTGASTNGFLCLR